MAASRAAARGGAPQPESQRCGMGMASGRGCTCCGTGAASTARSTAATAAAMLQPGTGAATAAAAVRPPELLGDMNTGDIAWLLPRESIRGISRVVVGEGARGRPLGTLPRYLPQPAQVGRTGEAAQGGQPN